jgi:hypothetical protein
MMLLLLPIENSLKSHFDFYSWSFFSSRKAFFEFMVLQLLRA